MPKVSNNNLLHGVSGKLGNNIVFRQSARGTVVANKPKKSKKISAAQVAVLDRFSDASYYASEQMKRPEAEALYKSAVTVKLNSGYLVAMTDYLTAPRITAIHTAEYQGAVGDVIKVRASDDFRVMFVTVVIRSATGEQLERGEATFPGDVHPDWVYTVKTVNPLLAGSTITVIAKDLPGNAVSQMVTL